MTDSIETRVAVMQSDITDLKTQLNEVKMDVSDTRQRVEDIGERLVRIETILETRIAESDDKHKVLGGFFDKVSFKELFTAVFLVAAFVAAMLIIIGWFM